MVAVTGTSVSKYPVFLAGQRIPLHSKHMLLGVVIDRGLTWSHIVSQIVSLKMKLTAFIHLTRFISGTTWGTRVSALLCLHQALFLGLLRYSLPAL